MTKIKFNNYLFILPVGFLLVFHIPFYFIFPPAYGSWQTWAYLGDGTYQSYLNGGVLFPPLYLKYYEIVNLISKDIWFSTTLGILRTILIYVVIYSLIIKEGYSKFVGTLTSMFFLITFISQDTYLPDDYHSMVKLLYILNIYFFYLVFKSSDKKSKIKNCIYSSILLVLVFLIKQNIGLMLLIGQLFTYIIWSLKEKNKNYPTLIFIVSTTLSIILLSYILKFNFSQILEITFKNDSKGGVISLLTNVVTLKINHKVATLTGIIAGIIFFISTQTWFNEKINFVKNKIINNEYLKSAITLLLVILFCYILIKKQDYILFIGFFTLWYTLYRLIKGENSILGIFFGPFLFLIIASTLTASINVEDMAIVCIPAVIGFAVLLEKIQSQKISIVYFLIFIYIGSTSIIKKFNTPWGWYGMSQSQISYSTYKLPFPELKLMHSDYITSIITNSIKDNIEKYSETNNDVLLYPNLPIFYFLTNKIPPYNVANYWFDTTPDNAVYDLLNNLSSNKKLPRLIIFLNPPKVAYEGHSSMRKKLVPQYQFIDQLQDLVSSGKYKLVDFKILNNRIYTSTKKDELLDIYLYPRLLPSNLSLSEIIPILQNSGVVIDNISSSKNLARIEVKVRYKDLEAIAKVFQWISPVEDNSYTLQIYKLQ